MIWHFPLPRVHTGVLLGNGTQGLMIWGETDLIITIGRAGHWDHRDGTPFTARTNFAELRAMLEANDEAGVKAAFASDKKVSRYRRPTQLGCGRLVVSFNKGMRPVKAELDLRSATVTVFLSNDAGAAGQMVIRQAMESELAWLECDVIREIRAIPTWEFIGEELAADGCAPPSRWQSDDAGGFCQTLPEDAAVALAWCRRGGQIAVATALGDNAASTAKKLAAEADLAKAAARTESWWRNYWHEVPKVRLPDPILQEAWEYGLYKQAGITPPQGVAATLQGPWMEDDSIPPWSNDYHFNINAQMIYWPALSTNRLAHFEPLWAMIRQWLPVLKENAERFFGVEGALMLPHAVDDRCSVVGSFWTGTIDHACTAWVAQMAWLHYRYSMDLELLRELAWPMLVGAFNGYWAMMEEVEEAGEKRLSFPISVSPEYGGSGMHAWGRDASFQLAACHFLAKTLPIAAELLGQPVDPRWAEVRERLPQFTMNDTEKGIALWKGQELSESHRHHSHLGAIYPFCTIQPQDPEYQVTIRRSLYHWLRTGAGRWTGWCLPWASILCSRADCPEAAVSWLHWWADVYTNIGRGTLHDADFGGVTGFDAGALWNGPSPHGHQIMQMDAGMGAITAITELLVQQRGEVLTVLPNLPRRWRELQFDGIRTEGAFLVGGTVENAKFVEVRIESLAGAHLRLAHGLGEQFSVNNTPTTGAVLEMATRVGDKLILRRA